jgi:hypothetical protein
VEAALVVGTLPELAYGAGLTVPTADQTPPIFEEISEEGISSPSPLPRTDESGIFTKDDIDFLAEQSKGCEFTVCGSTAATPREIQLRDRGIEMQKAGATDTQIMESTGLPDWRVNKLTYNPNAIRDFDYYSKEDLPSTVQSAIRNRWGDDIEFDNWNKFPNYESRGGLRFKDGKFLERIREPWQ